MLDNITNTVFKLGFDFLMKVKPPRVPVTFEGEGSSKELYEYIKKLGTKKLLIITTSGSIKRKLLDSSFDFLNKLKIEFAVFDEVQPNPSLSSVESAIEIYNKNHCDAILAFGGGSVIDAAKAVALQIGNDVPVEKLIGLFSARNEAVPLYAIPTTSGTGSEVTSAAVLTNNETHQKMFIIDHKIISRAVALDPVYMLELPPSITADTGMDALTHAIEAYISKLSTKEEMSLAVNAVRLVFGNLLEAYSNGKNIEARKNMSIASYQAGIAFNRMGLGFVHAISHQLTAFYGTPHGRANAIVLPYVLKASFDYIISPLAQLVREAGLNHADISDKELAAQFIDQIIKTSELLKIPSSLPEIQEKDIPTIIKNARNEAIRNYPVPYILSVDECEKILNELK